LVLNIIFHLFQRISVIHLTAFMVLINKSAQPCLKELIPYLKDAKRRGHKAFLRKGSLIVDGRAYGLSYLKGNIQLGDVNVDRQMDNPAGPQEDTTQTGNGATRESDTSQREEARGETPLRTGNRKATPPQPAGVRSFTSQQQQQGIAEVTEVRAQQYNLRGWVTRANVSASNARSGNRSRSGFT
jgi:hypothetical protein